MKKGLKYRLKLSKIFLAINRMFGGVIFGIARRLKKEVKGAPAKGCGERHIAYSRENPGENGVLSNQDKTHSIQ